MVVGIVFAVFGLLGPVEFLAGPSAYMAYKPVIGIVEIVVAALIVWYAWKSRRKT
jgi:hypothetical protein